MVRFVYRALRQEESCHEREGLWAKRPDANVAMHNAVGRNIASQYIHCTASPFVALYYAEAWSDSYSPDTYRRVVVIDLESEYLNADVTDLSTPEDCRCAGIHQKSKAWNFAAAHQVVLLEGDIHPTCILGSFDTEQFDITRRQCSFEQFVQELPMEASKFVATWISDLGPPCVENDAYENTFDTWSTFADGTHKRVYEGRYIKGRRAGYPCVVKMARDQRVMQEIFWQEDLNAVYKAQKIIAAFNRNWDECYHVYLNQPAVWTVKSGQFKRQKMLTEPMIMGEYQKFNSNSGYADCDDYMQALSHFSYHYTKGEVLICDLQGGKYGERYVLTDPVLMSRGRGRKYGPTDLGQDGIDNFFYYHECGECCGSHWRAARNPRSVFEACEGTSLLYGSGRVVGTSRLDGITEESDTNYYRGYNDSDSSSS